MDKDKAISSMIGDAMQEAQYGALRRVAKVIHSRPITTVYQWIHLHRTQRLGYLNRNNPFEVE